MATATSATPAQSAQNQVSATTSHTQQATYQHGPLCVHVRSPQVAARQWKKVGLVETVEVARRAWCTRNLEIQRNNRDPSLRADLCPFRGSTWPWWQCKVLCIESASALLARTCRHAVRIAWTRWARLATHLLTFFSSSSLSARAFRQARAMVTSMPHVPAEPVALRAGAEDQTSRFRLRYWPSSWLDPSVPQPCASPAGPCGSSREFCLPSSP